MFFLTITHNFHYLLKVHHIVLINFEFYYSFNSIFFLYFNTKSLKKIEKKIYNSILLSSRYYDIISV